MLGGRHHSKTQHVLRFRYALAVLAFLCMMLMNVGCAKNTNRNQTEAITSAPTISLSDNATPTSTSTPELTPTPTVAPYKTMKVNADDLLMYDIVVGDFFGEREDFEREFEKRKEYLKAFDVISDDETIILLAFINEIKYNRKYSKLIGESVKEKYLAYCTEENLEKLPDICSKIMAFNIENLENQIVFSSLGIDGIALGAKERVILNEVQKVMCEVANGYSGSLKKICITDHNQTRKYSIKTGDGERVRVRIDTDCLNNVCKYFVSALQIEVLKKVSGNTDSKEIINAYNNSIKNLDKTDDILLDLERLIETTNGLSGNYYPNDYYDPNSEFYQSWNPYYDMVIPDQKPIEERVEVIFESD